MSATPIGRSAALSAVAALAIALFAVPSFADAPKAAPEVDLELVLAVDVSYSMDTEEQRVQRDGYVAALTSPPVLDAIRDGVTGRIALAYVEWAGSDEQRVLVPWTLIDGPETAAAFANRLAGEPLRRAYRTSISSALLYGAKMFEASGFKAMRRVIDVSGDGPNNQGPPIEAMRDELIDGGVVINGLPLMLKRPMLGVSDIGDLDVYYRDCVIGGPGAFVLPVRSVAQFPDAVRSKLVMEIAGPGSETPFPPGAPNALPAAAQPKADCLAGEGLWRDRFGN
ncbi:DUF1194 domain-containing protein [Hansschlegelia quercus]|uniref:DUF1194 domain-containing protein n=1 Tax=Hansschlegelia quercus TaxID=2528245 RepID=A0A4Q9GI45_9HYPH|nr:DUF1194 domain-containing protein [Hansschlegelia quercus]TBN53863.1 DUF1194 domain-containing protein [Hansschlegelia quercus]